jgi:hypothetical protein
MTPMSSGMSRTTAKIGMLILGFTLAVSGFLVYADPELRMAPKLAFAAMLVLAGIASMVKALLLETSAPIRHRATGVGSRD